MSKRDDAHKLRELGVQIADIMDGLRFAQGDEDLPEGEAAAALEDALDHIDSAIRTLETEDEDIEEDEEDEAIQPMQNGRHGRCYCGTEVFEVEVNVWVDAEGQLYCPPKLETAHVPKGVFS